MAQKHFNPKYDTSTYRRTPPLWTGATARRGGTFFSELRTQEGPPYIEPENMASKTFFLVRPTTRPAILYLHALRIYEQSYTKVYAKQ